MKPVRILVSTIALGFLLPCVASAKEGGGFMIWLGRDTTSVERYMRDGNKLVVDQVGRSPRVLSRHFEYQWAADGSLSGVTLAVTVPMAPPGAPALQNIKVTPAADSLVMESRRDTIVQVVHVAAPKGTYVVALSSPWTMYEMATMKLAAGKADSLRVPMYILGGSSVDNMTVRRKGGDVMEIENVEGIYRIQVDKTGHVLHVTPIKGTAQFTVERKPDVDVAAFTAQYSAREKAAGTMGQLSPRDTVNAEAGGAKLWIDYSRPAKRGRVVFGGVVPYGELWRTGANAATQFRCDKALKFGETVVPAGMYTLWTIPGPTGWKLIINSETGQWGTEHKADKDLFTLDMTLSTQSQSVEKFLISVAPSSGGGTLQMDWDTTRASIPFTVQP